VTGVVRSAQGTPVPAATVSLAPVWSATLPANVAERETKTDAAGAFALDVPHGHAWNLRVACDGHPPIARERIELRGPEELRFDLAFPHERSLRGRLLGADGRPVAGATIGTASDSRREFGAQRFAVTDSGGAFEIPGFDATRPETRVVLHLHHEKDCRGEPHWDVDLRPDSPPCELRLPK
jgi:hypothetical protein